MNGVLIPLMVLGVGAFAVYLVARTITQKNAVLASLTALVYGVSLGFAVLLIIESKASPYPVWRPGSGESAMLQADPGALLLTMMSLSLGLLVTVYSGRYLSLDRRYEDYYPLLLLLSAGIVGMVMAVDLFTLYMFTMLASAAAYVLVAFRRETETAIEAGFKYVIMGGVGGILILAGIGYLYRETGTTSLPLEALSLSFWGRLGVGLMMAGYGIKSALVPSHTWLPDAHGRAPSSISAMLSGVLIEANVYVLIKVSLGLGWPTQQLGWLLIGMSLLNMTVGNALALVQVYGKRLLGYSSIAQVGYMTLALGIGLAYNRPEAISAGLYLMVAHAAMKGLAFLCKGVCHYYCDATLIEELRGIGHRAPIAASCFILALAGLVGVPPLAGFMAKWRILSSISREADLVIWLAIGAFMLNILLSLGYYLRLIGLILRRDDKHQERVHVSYWMLTPMIVLAVSIVFMGLFPQPISDLTDNAARFLLTWGPRG